MDAGKPAEAIANYQQALRLDPNSSQAHQNLGLALQAQGQADAAMKEFRAALQLQPDLESAEHNLANRLADAGRLEEAMAHYQAACGSTPITRRATTDWGSVTPCRANSPRPSGSSARRCGSSRAIRARRATSAMPLARKTNWRKPFPHYEQALASDPRTFRPISTWAFPCCGWAGGPRPGPISRKPCACIPTIRKPRTPWLP